MSTLFLLIYLLCTSASATVYYDYTVDIPSSAPPNSGMFVLVADGPKDNAGVFDSQTPQVINSDWAPMKCKLNANHFISIDIGMATSDFTSIPSTATCLKTVSGTQYGLRITLHQVTWNYTEGIVTNWATGFNVVTPLGTGWARAWNDLPVATYGYKSERISAIKSGSPWTGVECMTTASSTGVYQWTPIISISALGGSGSCVMHKWTTAAHTSTTTMVIPVGLTR